MVANANSSTNPHTITNPLTGEVITAAYRAGVAVRCCIWRAGEAAAHAELVTARRHGPLKQARECLERARRHYRRAVTFGAHPSALANAAQAGLDAAAVVAQAEALVERATAEEALRRLKQARALKLKGMNTREAARFVAEALVGGGYARDLTAAVALLAAEVPLPTATPDLILNAWMRLDAGAY